MNITLTEKQVRDLVELLGASSGVFGELAREHVGLPSKVFKENEGRCDDWIRFFSEEFNRQMEG